MRKIAGLIPVRFNSTRFPGKPLAKIGDKSMIERVYERAKSSLLDLIMVATDDSRIADHVKSFGGNVIMTSDQHTSGTDRCAEVAEKLKNDYQTIINIQGDEPFIKPEQINTVADLISQKEVQIATLVRPALKVEEVENQNLVKAVLDKGGKAIYFSRLPVPFYKDRILFAERKYFIHTGIYGYKIETLLEITKIQDSYLEQAESLEQLRWIENGYSVFARISDFPTYAVDIPEDIENLKKKFNL